MEENKKRISVSKKGFWWYTFFSFLLVTLLIFIAVMITHTATVRSLGSTYAEQLALLHCGVTKDEVKNLSTVQTYYNGESVFEVSYEKDGEKHCAYILVESGEFLTCKHDGNENPLPDNGNENPLPDNSNENPAPDEGNENPLPDNGNENPAPDDGNENPAPDNGNENPLPDNGNENPAPDNGNENPAPDNGTEESRMPRFGLPKMGKPNADR